jgi:hypothetical protein
MNIMTRRWSRRRLAPMLFIVLALTTGWVQSAALASTPSLSAGLGPTPTLSAGRLADDIAWPPFDPAANREPHGLFAHPVRPTVEVATRQPSAPAPAKRTYAGQNHFWIPSLGVSRPVYWYACSRTRAPDNLIYRWGCAGHNNVYILGHAYGVMKPLHDAYVSGRLHTGMLAVYADANGNVRTYRVTTWRLVRPTNAAWAEASQSVPSMTLQTCVGSQSQWRLIVRLVAVN